MVSVIKVDQEKICSILVAWYMCISYINNVISVKGVAYMNALFLSFVIFWGIRNRWIKVFKEWIYVIIYIFSFFLFSFIRVGIIDNNINYMMHFLAFGIGGILIGVQKFNINLVIKYIIVIGIVGLPVTFYRGFSWMWMDSSRAMGLAYALLPIICASLIGFCYGLKYCIMSIVLILSFTYFYINMAPRGVLVAAGAYLALLGYYHIYIKRRRINIAVVPIIVSSGIFLFAVYISNHMVVIVERIVDVLDKRLHMEIYALNKILRYASKNDILNRRDDIWTNAWESAKSHLILGNGIGYFEQNELTYPHNIFLQSMNEAGLFFTVPLIVLSVILVILLLFYRIEMKDRKEYYFISLLFVTGFLPLLYSSCYWIMNPFWILLGYMMHYTKKRLRRTYKFHGKLVVKRRVSYQHATDSCFRRVTG